MAERKNLFRLDIEVNDKGFATFTVARYKERYPWWQRHAWDFRRMSLGGKLRLWFKTDRWAFDLPWITIIVELWFLRRKF